MREIIYFFIKKKKGRRVQFIVNKIKNKTEIGKMKRINDMSPFAVHPVLVVQMNVRANHTGTKRFGFLRRFSALLLLLYDTKLCPYIQCYQGISGLQRRHSKPTALSLLPINILSGEFVINMPKSSYGLSNS